MNENSNQTQSLDNPLEFYSEGKLITVTELPKTNLINDLSKLEELDSEENIHPSVLKEFYGGKPKNLFDLAHLLIAFIIPIFIVINIFPWSRFFKPKLYHPEFALIPSPQITSQNSGEFDNLVDSLERYKQVGNYEKLYDSAYESLNDFENWSSDRQISSEIVWYFMFYSLEKLNKDVQLIEQCNRLLKKCPMLIQPHIFKSRLYLENDLKTPYNLDDNQIDLINNTINDLNISLNRIDDLENKELVNKLKPDLILLLGQYHELMWWHLGAKADGSDISNDHRDKAILYYSNELIKKHQISLLARKKIYEEIIDWWYWGGPIYVNGEEWTVKIVKSKLSDIKNMLENQNG